MKNTLKLVVLGGIIGAVSMGLQATTHTLQLGASAENHYSSCCYDDQSDKVTCQVKTPRFGTIEVPPVSFPAHSICQGNPDTNNPYFIGTYDNPNYQRTAIMGGQNRTCSVIKTTVPATPPFITQ